MGVKEFYDDMYRDDKPQQTRLPLYSRILSATLGRFSVNRYELTYQVLPGGDTILDIGCGDDLTLLPLWEKYEKVYGIDISPTRIERMQQQFGDNPDIHLSVGDVNNRLDFADVSFDTIIALAVLEHIFDPYHIIEECHRLLKPGGYCIVHVPNVGWLGNGIRLLAGRLPVTAGCGDDWAAGHLHYFTTNSLKKLFQKFGFEVVKIAYGGPSRRFWGSLLSKTILMAGIKK